MARVAAIIPTFNREHCIARAIESVLAQTFRDLETIVIDDGSTDSTREVVGRFGDRVRYIRQDNAGQGPARNRGAASTDAEWLAFLDSDDVWRPTKIERQLAFAESHDAAVCFTDFSLKKNLTGDGFDSWAAELRARGRQAGVATGVVTSPLRVVAGPGDLVFTSTVMVRRDAFERAGGYNPAFRRCQDVELHLRLALRERWAFLDEPLATKDWTGNASAEKTYLYRTAALRSALDAAIMLRDADAARTLRAAMRSEFRALAGRRRADSRALAAAKAWLGVLFPTAVAARPSDLARRAAAL